MSRGLANHAEHGVVIFCGAGVSMVAPTYLPSWWQMNAEVVQALVRQIEPLCGAERAANWAKQINARREAQRFPPEFQAEIIAKHYGPDYFKVLQCLDGDEPNEVHFAIAALARSGHVRAVVTSNFDRLLELAFAKSGVPLDVSFHAAHFERLAGELATPAALSRCQLLKLHGSIDDHLTLVDTLAQRMRGLPPAITSCLQLLLRRYYWLFLGYSGRDLEGNPHYLSLRPEVSRAVGFSWLVRDSATDEPIAAVRALCSLYGERAEVPRGTLPDWFLKQFEPFLPPDFPRPPALSEEALDRRRRNAAEAIVEHAREWSVNVGRVRAALAIASMLERSVANPLEAEALLRATLSAPDTPGSAYFIVANALVNTLAATGRLDEALALGDDALSRVDASDEADRAGLLNNLGLIDRDRGEYRLALERFDQVYADSMQRRDEERKGIALNNRAMVLAALGRPEEAMASYKEELEIVTASGDALAQAQTLNNLGELLGQQDRYAEAIDHLHRAIALRDRLGDDRGVASSLGNIAAVYQRQGQLAEAKSTYEAILATFRCLSDPMQEVTTLRNLGGIVQELHDFQEAERLYRQAAALADQHGMEVQRASALQKLGSLYRNSQRGADARPIFDEALTIFRSRGDQAGEADVLHELSILDWQDGRLDVAEQALNQVVDIRERLGATGLVAGARFNLGGLLQLRGDIDQALASFDIAQDLYLQTGQTGQAIETLALMGEIHGVRGAIGASLHWFDRAIPLAANSEHRKSIAMRLVPVFKLLQANGYAELAQQYVQRLNAVGAKVTIRQQPPESE
jgi:tetratricopeptide (TPR) repeat protein